jgi:DNA-binding transcriptional MerR regulator
MSPLFIEIYNLVAHGILISRLKGDNHMSVYNKISSFNGRYVYAPADLHVPILRFITNCNKQFPLKDALRFLAYITTPQEWIVFIKKQLKQADADKRSLLLQTLAELSISQSHINIELPYFTKIINAHASRKIVIDTKRDQALTAICRFLGNKGNKNSLLALRRLEVIQYKTKCRWVAAEAVRTITRREKKHSLDMFEKSQKEHVF